MRKAYKKSEIKTIPILWNHDARQYLRRKGGTMKLGDKVQVWSENNHICLGWGKVIRLVLSIKNRKEVTPLIELESGKTIWGDQCYWIEEKKAIEIGVRLFRDIHKRPGS